MLGSPWFVALRRVLPAYYYVLNLVRAAARGEVSPAIVPNGTATTMALLASLIADALDPLRLNYRR